MAGKTGREAMDKLDLGELPESMFAGLDPRPKLVVDPDLNVQWHSMGAEILLSPPVPVRLVDGVLSFPADNRSNGAIEFLENVTEVPSQHLLRAQAKGHWALLHAWAMHAEQRLIAIVCSLSVPYRRVTDSGLTEELNLTRAEAKVLDRFARLRSPKEIASDLDVSLGTVRSHLKQIYSKAGVETAVQLLQLTRGYCFQ